MSLWERCYDRNAVSAVTDERTQWTKEPVNPLDDDDDVNDQQQADNSEIRTEWKGKLEVATLTNDASFACVQGHI